MRLPVGTSYTADSSFPMRVYNLQTKGCRWLGVGKTFAGGDLRPLVGREGGSTRPHGGGGKGAAGGLRRQQQRSHRAPTNAHFMPVCLRSL